MKRLILPQLGLLLIGLFALAPSAWTQNSYIKFEKTNHDFGQIKEENGSAEATFNFTNTADKPIKLTYVKASCGCTTPDWTKEEVGPGEEGYVKAVYDTKGRKGQFSKSVTVRVTTLDNIGTNGRAKDNQQAQTEILRIKGDVKAAPPGVEQKYPFKIGNLRFSKNHIAMGMIKDDEQKRKSITIYNTSKTPVTIKKIEQPGEHIQIAFLQKGEPVAGDPVVPAEDTLGLQVQYDASKKNSYLLVHDILKLHTDDANSPRKNLYVSANIRQDFSHLSPDERKNAAHINFERTKHNFGSMTQGDVAKTEFAFTNTGKNPLKILKVETSCGCTASAPEKKLIQPGESSKINVTFNSRGKSNVIRKRITVVTNDPDNPVQRLTIQAKVNTGS